MLQASEKKAQRDWHKLDSTSPFYEKATLFLTTCSDNRHQPSVPVNESLGELLDAVKDYTDPWLLFLLVSLDRLHTFAESNPAVTHRKALFLSRLSRREEAIESALLSIAGFRWNWSTWSLLGSCIGDGEEVIPLYLALFMLTTLTAIISAPFDSLTNRSSAGSNFPNKDPQRTSQSF